MSTATVTTLDAVVTLVDDLRLPAPQRCGGVLGHINGLAEDGEWHCHLPDGHDDVCLVPDGTTW
jgi:hypothetical protein